MDGGGWWCGRFESFVIDDDEIQERNNRNGFCVKESIAEAWV